MPALSMSAGDVFQNGKIIDAMDAPSPFVVAMDLVGAVASIAGLLLSLYVLRVAKGARKAAEEARLLARRRNLVEELDDASEKLQQVGNFLQQREFVAVQMRTAEVLVICREAMARWSDHLSKKRRSGVLTAITHVQTIATQLAEIGQRELTPQEKRNLTESQLKAAGHISDALGEARRLEERNGLGDGD